MHRYRICFFAFAVLLTVTIAGQKDACAQTTDVLSEAPKHFRFYANQLKSNFEKIETLKGEIHCSFRSLRDVAVFYRDRGDQLGIEEITKSGNFIRVDVEEYKFTWDLQSDNLVSIGVPSDKPTFYLDAETEIEVKPEFRNSVIGAEETTLINSRHKISTSGEKETADGQHKIYEQTQNNFHEKRGSPKSVFQYDSDLTFHEFLFAIAEQLESQKDVARSCTLNIEGDLHSLELVAISSTDGGPLVSQFVFDASRSFALVRHEYRVREEKRVTKYEWDFPGDNSTSSMPIALTIDVFIDEELIDESSYKLLNLVANEKLSEDNFSIAALGPRNGDFLFDKESGETFVIQDLGAKLIPANTPLTSGASRHLVLYAVTFLALAVGLFVVRRRMNN